MSIEIDPREIEMNLAEHLFNLGFNRLSIGVQDIDKKVQETINRLQSTEFIRGGGSSKTFSRTSSMTSSNVNIIFLGIFQDRGSVLQFKSWSISSAAEQIDEWSYDHLQAMPTLE